MAESDPGEHFHEFLSHVETNNVHQVKSRLRLTGEDAVRLVGAAAHPHCNTALHRAVSLGLVEMSGLLVEAGADVDALNLMGDAPIHCCWRFWTGDAFKYHSWKKHPHLMTTPQQLEEFHKMVGSTPRWRQRHSCHPAERLSLIPRAQRGSSRTPALASAVSPTNGQGFPSLIPFPYFSPRESASGSSGIPSSFSRKPLDVDARRERMRNAPCSCCAC